MANTESRYSFGRILTLATDARVMSWPVIITCAVLSVLIHLAPNGGTVEGNIFVRMIVAVFAYLPGLATIAIFSLFLRNVANARLRVGLMLFSYFLGGALRGLFFAIVFYQLGMSTSLNLDFRIPGSAIPFGLAIAAATYAVSALDESKARIASLGALQSELNDAVAASATSENTLRDRTITKIEQSVQTELEALKNIDDVATPEQLKALAAEVVRPLSHTLAERVPVWEPTEKPQLRLRWRDILGQIRPELSLKPLLLTLLSTATALTAFIFFFGIAQAIPLTICSLVVLYLSTRLAERLTTRLNNMKSLLLRAVLMTALLVLVSLPGGFVDAIILHGENEPFFILQGGMVIVPIFGWFIALGGAAQAESERLENAYNEGIAQLSWLKARLNLVNWYEQGEFARVLHGPVQSAINKGVIKLGSTDVASRADVIAEVREGITAALAPELRWEGERRRFEELCDDLALTWSELCQIDFAISPAACAAINADPACASLSWDVIHESCNNAIKHGEARWISVRIIDPVDRTLTIDVVNNGEAADVESRPGMGSNMLDACTLSWARSPENGQTTLRAILPIQA
jgi:signal transduction histidine kinase